ncbi:MAG: TetR/AcrR family transcriptional regulator [Clostridiales bacterium]|nr:TetR/AcrR family transcriptional regulator [Clostridiales bacterium]MBS5877906.1 TetR/AcrR family transcriptional regulator [Clostridiales bacterium]
MAVSTYEELSINKIIKEAGIPSGSFYAYFEDKYDLCSYLSLHVKSSILKKFRFFITEEKGDVFKAYLDLRDYVKKYIKGKFDEATSFQLMIFFNNAGFKVRAEEENCYKTHLEQEFNKAFEAIDPKLYNKSVEDLRTMFEIIANIVFNNIASLGADDPYDGFYRRIDFLKNSFGRN